MTAPLKIAVLGSNSFSGASFVAYSLKQGAEVLGISRSTEPDSVFLPYRWPGDGENFHFHAYDINRHLDEIMALLAMEQPEYLVNFAAQSMVGQSWDAPEDWFRTNVVSSTKLFSRLSQEALFLKRYIHITTPEVYGATDGWIREGVGFNPSTPYAVSRAAGDMSLKTFIDACNLPATMTRAANVYGPGQQLYRIIPRTVLFIRMGRKIPLHGGGYSERSFIHIDDVSDATWKVMSKGKIGETYHISTREIISIRDLVERICTRMDVSFLDAVEMEDERRGKDAAYMLDSSKIRETLGWGDRVTLNQGIDECIAWVDGHLETLMAQNLDYVHKP